jgi:modulator of FtsH protease
MANDLAGWQNFYLMAGGAAAALTGLIFVALSMHTKVIMAHPLLSDRALASIQSLMAQVFLAGAVLVPAQPRLALGLEVELVAAWFAIRTVYAVRLIRSVDARIRRRPTSRWFAEWTAWLLWLVTLIASGVALATGAPVGFYLLAIAMAYMFGSNVWNSWVLIAEVSR